MLIKFKKEEENIRIQLGTSKLNEIVAGKKHSSWNTKEVNDFLKKIVESNPEGEKLETQPKLEDIDKNKDFDLFLVVKLFTAFINEYNETNESNK